MVSITPKILLQEVPEFYKIGLENVILQDFQTSRTQISKYGLEDFWNT